MDKPASNGCCWYHKGTNFQANHNIKHVTGVVRIVVADTTKVRIFKQITTTHDNKWSGYLLLLIPQRYEFSSKSQRAFGSSISTVSCCWYHKGTNFQANHNSLSDDVRNALVVADTTKVRIFKQITTSCISLFLRLLLLLIPQRYEFSSKSQQLSVIQSILKVVADTTKVRIFKQITTNIDVVIRHLMLLLIPQRYEFSSKSQLLQIVTIILSRCCWYHKGTNFQANHNCQAAYSLHPLVVADTTKVRIFKQITT